MLIGVALIANGLEFHIPRDYICLATAFAPVFETIRENVLALGTRRKRRVLCIK